MYSLIREEKYELFALECPWLGEIRSCDSPAGCKLLKVLGLFKFSCLGFPIPLVQEFSLLLTILHNIINPYKVQSLEFSNVQENTILPHSFTESMPQICSLPIILLKTCPYYLCFYTQQEWQNQDLKSDLLTPGQCPFYDIMLLA